MKSSSPAGSGVIRHDAFRPVSALVLLAIELLAFSLYFDVLPLQQSSSLVARLAGYGTAAFRVVAVAIFVLLVVGRRRLPEARARLRELTGRDRELAKALGLHVVAAAVFVAVSTRLLSPNAEAAAGWWVWPWFLVGAAAIAGWLLTFAPARFWIELWERRNVTALAASMLVGLLVYVAGQATGRLWRPLGDVTFYVCEWLLRLISVDVVSHPESRLLGVGGFVVTISRQCSGYEGIGLMVATLVAYFIMFRRELRFPQALWLLPLGVLTIWLMNVVRIVALILLGVHVSPEMAVGGFHSQAGWIAFAAVSLTLAAVALHSPYFAKLAADQRAGARIDRPPTEAYLLPLMAVIAVSMVTGALSTGFDRLYPLKVIAGAAACWYFRAAYGELKWCWSWPAVGIGVGVFILWMALEPYSDRDGTSLSEGIQQLPASLAATWLALRVLGSVVVVPVVEELAFRGYLMRRIGNARFDLARYRDASWIAVVLSSLLFGLLHGRWLAAALAGVAYAVAARSRNSLCDAIVAHAVTNGLIAAYVLAARSWGLWA